MQLEASDQPNFMLVGRCVIDLLYRDANLNGAERVAGRFVKTFRDKLAAESDVPALVSEWAVAAVLDPR